MKRYTTAALVCVVLLLFVITCSNQSNPFLNKADSIAKIISRNALNTDTVEIFSTQKFLAHVYLREHIDSIKVHVDNNRLQSQSPVVRHGDITGELSFQYSFFATGKQTIHLVSYVNNGDIVIDSCTLYAVSPLRQKSISGKAGDSLFLSTPPVDDQVMYVWNLQNGTVVKETMASVGIKLTNDFTGRSGELYVEDLYGFRSPSHIFGISSSADTESQMSIFCLHDSIVADSVYSKKTEFKFTVIVTGANQLKSARVNDIPFDDSLKAGESFVLSRYLYNLDTLDSPVKMDVLVSDNKGNIANKIWLIHFVKMNPLISIYSPAQDSMTTASSFTDVRGTVINNQHYDKLYLLALKNGNVTDSAVVTPQKATFFLNVPLADYSNHITLELYADSLMIGSKYDVADFHVYYNPAYIDTTAPQIRSVRCNDELVVDSMISRTDTLRMAIDAVDNSNQLYVYVNGNKVEKGSGSLFFTTSVIIPRTKNYTLIEIKALDSSGYAVYDSLYVKCNRLPQWIKIPEYMTVVTAGEESVFDVTVSDPDQDSLFVTMMIKGGHIDTLLDATSGYVTWHPQLSDSGQYKVYLNATDRTEYVDAEFTLIVKGNGAVPAKLLKNGIKFPDTVVVGEPFEVVLRTAPLTGTGPFTFSAAFVDERAKNIHNSTDTMINWVPAVSDTGLRILRVMVTDALNFKDSMDVHFRVIKKILACVRWRQNTAQFHESTNFFNTARVSITLSNPLDFKVSIPYAITFPNETNAANAADLGPVLSGVFTFDGNGDTSASINITIIDDKIPEYVERFEIRITGNDSIKVCDLSDPVFVGEIIDNDNVTYSFVETEAEGLEGRKNLVAKVKISKALQTELVLYYEIDWLGTTADTLSDFVLGSTDYRLIFAPGETLAQIEIEIVDDSIQEENEKITIRLRSETEFALPKDSAKFVYTIMNDDTPARFSFASAKVEWVERDTQMTVPVRLDRGVDSIVIVKYSVVPEKTTATTGVDFRIAEISDSIVFNPGETIKSITIELIDDTLPEMTDEFFTLKLESPGSIVEPGYPAECEFTILRNEAGAYFASQFQEGDEEYNRTPYCEIMLNKPSDVPITVTFSSDNSTAEYGSDYTMKIPDLNQVTFNPGETKKDLGIRIVDDEKNEMTEYIRLVITGVSDLKRAYILEEKKNTEIRIINN